MNIRYSTNSQHKPKIPLQRQERFSTTWVLSANDEEQPVTQTASVMTLDETTSAFAVAGLEYYSYSYGTTTETIINYGCGGEYRQVDAEKPNCLGYALFSIEEINLNKYGWPDSHLTEDFSYKFESAIKSKYSCRRIASYDDAISSNEYRLAVRCPNLLDGVHVYHVIYQLSDGTWAGKNFKEPSKHFGSGNPSVSPEMWENNAYSPRAGTIYFAVAKY